MNKQILNPEILNPEKVNEKVSVDVEKGLNEDLLSSQELGNVEGGFCDYTCIACASSGLFSF
jgi:hypothetical protein